MAASAIDRPVRTAAPDPLGWLIWLARIGVAALLVGRFLGPSLTGVWVGMATPVRLVEVLGGALSQLFAISTIVGLGVVLATAVAANIAPWIRVASIGIAALAALMVVGGTQSIDRVPETSLLFVALASGAFAILAAISSRRAPVARVPALALGAVGAASAARAVAGLLYASALVAPARLVTIERSAATVAAILVALADLLALVYIGRAAPVRPDDEAPAAGPPERASLWSPITLAVIVIAALCARQAAAGANVDASGISVVLKRASDLFLVQPDPYMRLPIRLFLGFLTPLTAAALLFVRRVRTLSAALCLLLVAADVTNAPLGAITLVVAALGILLIARSGHVLWSALVARPPAAPSGTS